MTKDLVNNQPSDAVLSQLVSTIVNGFHPTHISQAIPLDTNAAFVTQGNTPSPRTVVAFTQKVCDTIHNAGVGVLFRGTFCNMENIYSFPFLPSTGGGFVPQGTAASAPTDGSSTWLGRVYQYITTNPTFFQSGDIIAFFPEQTSYVFNGNTFLNQTGLQTNYVNFFSDLPTVCTAALTAVSVTGVHVGFTSNNYSEIASSWIGGSLFTNVGMTAVDYYGNYNGDGYAVSQFATDLNNIITSTGQNLFYQEFADLWNAGITPQQRIYYMDTFYRMLTSLGSGLFGVNYWGGWAGAQESVLYIDANGNFQLNGVGKLLAAYFNTDGLKALPVIDSNGNF